MSSNLKRTETTFSHIQHAQMPRTRDLAIFVPTITTDRQTDCFTPCEYAQDKKLKGEVGMAGQKSMHTRVVG